MELISLGKESLSATKKIFFLVAGNTQLNSTSDRMKTELLLLLAVQVVFGTEDLNSIIPTGEEDSTQIENDLLKDIFERPIQTYRPIVAVLSQELSR